METAQASTLEVSDALSLEIITAVILMQAFTLVLLIIRTNGIKTKTEEQTLVLKSVLEKFTSGLADMKESINRTLNKLNDSVITLDKAAEKIFTLSKTHYDSDIRDHAALGKDMHNLINKVDGMKDRQTEMLSEFRNKN